MNGYFYGDDVYKVDPVGVTYMSHMRDLLTPEAVKRINRLIKLVGSQRKLAKIMGITNTAIHLWCKNLKTPSDVNIMALEILTSGYIDRGLLKHGIVPSVSILLEKTLYYDFTTFMVKNYVKDEEDLAYYPLNIRRIVKSNIIYEKDLRKLMSYFGNSLEYWLCVKNIFNNKVTTLLNYS